MNAAAAGLGIVALSGIFTASFAYPMKFSRAWHWENTWLVYATFALLIIPDLLAAWAVPLLDWESRSTGRDWKDSE